MAWLLVYASVAVAILVVLAVRYASSVRGDILRLVAIVTAASLWPLMAVGLLQYAAIQVIAACLRHTSSAPVAPVTTEPDAAATPSEIVDSLARLAQQISATRPV